MPSHRLFDRDNLLVASFAVLTDDNDAWRPGQFRYELWGCKINFEFPIVKLADYRDRWADSDDEYYRYANGYVYRVDYGSGLIEEAYPAYG